MDRMRGSAKVSRHGRRFAAAALLAALTAPVVPARAQTPPPPGSTINGSVPSAEGNVWGGLDHQPTPSEVAPLNNQQEQAKINHKLSKLDQQLLNYKLPKVPVGAPPVAGELALRPTHRSGCGNNRMCRVNRLHKIAIENIVFALL